MELFIGELMDVPNFTYFRLLSRKNQTHCSCTTTMYFIFSFLKNKIMSLLLWPSKYICIFRSIHIYFLNAIVTLHVKVYCGIFFSHPYTLTSPYKMNVSFLVFAGTEIPNLYNLELWSRKNLSC